MPFGKLLQNEYHEKQLHIPGQDVYTVWCQHLIKLVSFSTLNTAKGKKQALPEGSLKWAFFSYY